MKVLLCAAFSPFYESCWACKRCAQPPSSAGDLNHRSLFTLSVLCCFFCYHLPFPYMARKHTSKSAGPSPTQDLNHHWGVSVLCTLLNELCSRLLIELMLFPSLCFCELVSFPSKSVCGVFLISPEINSSTYHLCRPQDTIMLYLYVFGNTDVGSQFCQHRALICPLCSWSFHACMRIGCCCCYC